MGEGEGAVDGGAMTATVVDLVPLFGDGNEAPTTQLGPGLTNTR